ncbi:MAG: hypothetical protein NTW17_00485 [Candidatus Pacearchaeota archaeon]|nr:hypothetical protein [Candidatus Pacearchaeota archaeon]
MSRSKITSKLLRKLNGDGAVFDENGTLIGRGNLQYNARGERKGLYLGQRQIPLSAVRNICPRFNGQGHLVFINSGYPIMGASS